MLTNTEIERFMTPLPHAVDVGQTVSDALHRMRALHVGHLPVLDSDQLVGMLSERELSVLEEAQGFHPESVPVGDVMRSQVCSVPPAAPLADVVRDMAEQHSDCCAVLDQGRIVGILTSTDAMRILSELLASETDSDPCPQQRPSEIRSRILDEHAVLRKLLDEIDQLAASISDDEDPVEAALRERCRELHSTLLRHIELEDALLVPALRQTDAFGDARADQLLSEHASQMQTILAIFERLDDLPSDELAVTVAGVVDALRVDMKAEEHELLHPDLLRDDVILVASTG